VVQDVVTGLTFIFSDLVDVGDLVEISGQTGIVRAITMRFVELENALGASVFIPNRTINNVINYPRGYVRCVVDITLRGDEARQDSIEATAIRLMETAREQFPGIFVSAPSSEGRFSFGADKKVLRIKFRIWPTRQQPIETAFYQELIAEITKSDPDFKPWMVTINYEVEARVKRPSESWLWTRRR
jgi:small conductance mechanosensitive channel